MKTPSLVFPALLLVSLQATSQLTTANNGLTASGATVSLGGTLNNAQTFIDFGSGNGSSNFLFKKGTSNYLFIGNNGNVGIGTINPTAPLDVNGVINATNLTLTSSDNIFKFGIGAVGWRLDLSSGGAGDSHFRFGSGGAWSYNFNTGTGHITRIWDGGVQVGLGNANGAASLHVRRKSPATDIARFEDLGGAAKFVLLGDGKAGFGTATPLTKFDMGEIRFGDIATFPADGGISETIWGNYIIGDANGFQRLRMGVVNDGISKAEIFLDNSNTPSGSISFKTSGTGVELAATRMFIDGTGRVGIGTTTMSTGFKLFVEEGVRTRRVKVDIGSWSDFVFHPTYSLRPLAEVEKYIQKHHHLPDVPSAEEVTTNGLDLGANQAVLLQKIEELTLYMINQEKSIAEQKKQIEELRKEVTKLKGANKR